MTTPPWAGVILAGGRGLRLGGRDKALLEVGGATLLERAVGAAERAGASEIVVVGPARPGYGHRVRWVREEPAGGGPGAALLAGRDAVTAGVQHIAVWAVDMPGITGELLARLLAASRSEAPSAQPPGAPSRGDSAIRDRPTRDSATRDSATKDRATRDGAVLCDVDGRRQLAYALQAARLDEIRPAHPDGIAIHRLLAPLDLVEISAASGVADDIDTETDLRLARERTGEKRWRGEPARLDR